MSAKPKPCESCFKDAEYTMISSWKVSSNAVQDHTGYYCEHCAVTEFSANLGVTYHGLFMDAIIAPITDTAKEGES